MKFEARLEELGITLPPVPQAAGNYVHAAQIGNVLYLAGKGPRNADGSMPTGKVGAEVSAEEAYWHARSVGLTLIAVLKETLGDLDRVKRIAKVLGMVNATPDFGDATPARPWAWARCPWASRWRSRRSSRWSEREASYVRAFAISCTGAGGRWWLSPPSGAVGELCQINEFPRRYYANGVLWYILRPRWS
jgi:enamine deaminase RidA (YjgF/YER057c/UK114 family)